MVKNSDTQKKNSYGESDLTRIKHPFTDSDGHSSLKCFHESLADLLIKWHWHWTIIHYSDVIVSSMASQIASISIVYSTVCSGANQTKHQSSASLAFVRGIHRRTVNSLHKGPVKRNMFLMMTSSWQFIWEAIDVAHHVAQRQIR